MVVPLVCVLLLAGAAAESMRVHESWSPTTACSMDHPPTSPDFNVTVERTAVLMSPSISLRDAGHAITFPNGDVQVLVRHGCNQSHAVRSSNRGVTWAAVPNTLAPWVLNGDFEPKEMARFVQNHRRDSDPQELLLGSKKYSLM